MTAQNTLKTKPKTDKRALAFYRLNEIIRAGGMKAAAVWKKGRNKNLVGPGYKHNKSGDHAPNITG